MVDIVEEEVELHLIDTRQLVEEAKKLKKLADIKKKQNDILKKSPSKLRGEKELLKRLNRENLAKGVSPLGLGVSGDVLPKGFDKKQTRKVAITGQKTNVFLDAQKRIKNLERIQRKIKKQVNDVQDKIVDKLDLANTFLGAGAGGTIGAFGNIANKFGPIGVAITAIVAAIVPQYFEQFERGGIFSTALPITEREKNIVDIDYVVDVRSGTKFLTSDLRMAQKAPETSNTLNLRYEHIRYTSQELGR